MKISVLMMAYKHGKFITQAVESVLMQETSFDFEILVGEDASNDGTREILTGFQQNYPEKIRLFLNEQNMGMHKNFHQLLQSAQGEYIAILEGDDYWTSAKKLQKQVEFLDKNNDFSVCFHNALKIDEENGLPLSNYCADDQKDVCGFEDLLTGNFIPTCSILFRKQLLLEMPDWTRVLPMLDWALLILLAEQGKIGYLNEVMGVYRVHAGGVWSPLRYFQKLIGSIQFLTAAKDNMNSVHKKQIEERLVEYWKIVSRELYDQVENISSVDEAVSIINNEVKKLPTAVHFPKPLLRKLCASVYASHGFHSFNSRDYIKSRYCWRNAILNDISWLKEPRRLVNIFSIYCRQRMIGPAASRLKLSPCSF